MVYFYIKIDFNLNFLKFKSVFYYYQEISFLNYPYLSKIKYNLITMIKYYKKN
jgi:hypothetical protein